MALLDVARLSIILNEKEGLGEEEPDTDVVDEEEGISTATIGMTIGVYGEDKNAWMDLLSIMERIRQRICNNRTVARKYPLEYPNKWETVEAQPYPFWFGYGTVKYRVGHPNPQGGLLWQ